MEAILTLSLSESFLYLKKKILHELAGGGPPQRGPRQLEPKVRPQGYPLPAKAKDQGSRSTRSSQNQGKRSKVNPSGPGPAPGRGKDLGQKP